ncbi:succinyl-diaminopimelate desuccinylase [Salirhabdus euzebyi]|uniref:Succinyl-diaminopimelate desuccinylase n=1 Tax=Salirhabdus euzebyi TaxID=394506 RepID=A0A841Q9F9_9BACI|nr:dipeptidase PepV [Salirhabdus euzebyi]MBB6454934.1 succinyl-diaminopimelate desuccinylase [Salirhabdus euzebyi]
MVNWHEEVVKRKDELINDLFGLLQIESVKDEQTKTAEHPMGAKIGEALQYVLNLSEKAGFDTKNIDGFAGHGQYGSHDNATNIGVLCHVDVVPATGTWTSPPFEPAIRAGKIYARGAIDDKGPTIAAFYGLKIVKELGLPLSKNVRIIFGTDEESGMSCMRHYKEVENMPAVGFAPDADFPIIHAEKGQINVKLTVANDGSAEQSSIELVSFEAGNRINMVPERAKVVLKGATEQLHKDFMAFCDQEGLQYNIDSGDSELELTLFGVSAHGMEPHIGLNAGTTIATFLQNYDVQQDAITFLQFIATLHKDYEGNNLGITYCDDLTGPLTVNPGILSYQKGSENVVYLNIRCPVSTNYEQTKNQLKATIEEKGFRITDLRQSNPHHVDGDHPMIHALQKAYQEETGLEPTLLSTGGGTYARFMEKGVAFGACFPGKEMTAHQKDEYIEVEDLLKATAIYARAIYELAK